ncbi:CoA transferase [Pseudonocardia xishanensis]|uniref:CaiB/BaiF CoA-transferase family protein n=1 Tax=Pseudonocardia xishanensis TaxID=630995 RepID=A0ABP8RTG3_9PSEU
MDLAFFRDLRVLELGVWMAAPSTAALLADLGADVVKVEGPAGDPARAFFAATGTDAPVQPTFALDNRGKRSLVIDLADPSGRGRFEELLGEADVLVVNLRQAALRKLGLTAEELCPRFPRLVYGSLTAHGLDGPDADEPGYDVGAFWARSGLSHQLAGGSPLHAPGAYGDHVTGLALFSAVLAALLERERTGRGGLVETSLLQTATWIAGPDLAVQATLGKVHPVADRRSAVMPLVNSYRTADDRWFFLTCVEGARHLPAVCTAIGRPWLAADERFASPGAMRRHRRELIALLDEAFAGDTLDRWAERFAAAGVWWQVVARPAEVLADPQVAANGWARPVEVGPGVVVDMLTAPMRVLGCVPEGVAGAPALGSVAPDGGWLRPSEEDQPTSRPSRP